MQFTAAQAAQENEHLDLLAQCRFTAAQAAQEISQHRH